MHFSSKTRAGLVRILEDNPVKHFKIPKNRLKRMVADLEEKIGYNRIHRFLQTYKQNEAAMSVMLHYYVAPAIPKEIDDAMRMFLDKEKRYDVFYTGLQKTESRLKHHQYDVEKLLDE